MSEKLIPVAIAYDFDGTLAPGNMQEYSLLPKIGIKPDKFWAKVKRFAKKHDMDEVLAYMRLILEYSRKKEKPIRRSNFVDYGKKVKFFPGVSNWFDRINKFGKDNSIEVHHYIISSGMKELIEGTKIAKRGNFKQIFASSFMYDVNDVACWPALAINYTTKVQYLFRIHKGIDNAFDNSKINQKTPDKDRLVPFSNIIYLGDAETDIPSMKMTRYQGGHAIMVYDPNSRKIGKKTLASRKRKANKLVKDDRADYALPADYRKGSDLEQVVMNIMKKVAIERQLAKYGKDQK